MHNTFEVFEDNSGCISLVVLHDGQPIYVSAGYERREAELFEDIEARDEAPSWDAEGNYLNYDPFAYDNLLEFVWLGDNRVNLIADDNGVYYDVMGAEGHRLFPAEMGANDAQA